MSRRCGVDYNITNTYLAVGRQRGSCLYPRRTSHAATAGGANSGTLRGSLLSVENERWSACAWVRSIASRLGRSVSAIPGRLTRGRNRPRVSSKFGSVSNRWLPISTRSVACPMYVTRIGQPHCTSDTTAMAVAPQVLRYNGPEDVGRELLRPRWGGCRHCLGSFIRDEPLLRNGCQILHRIVQIEPRGKSKEEHRHHHG